MTNPINVGKKVLVANTLIISGSGLPIVDCSKRKLLILNVADCVFVALEVLFAKKLPDAIINISLFTGSQSEVATI